MSLWSQNSIIKATPTACICGPRNARMLPSPLPWESAQKYYACMIGYLIYVL